MESLLETFLRLKFLCHWHAWLRSRNFTPLGPQLPPLALVETKLELTNCIEWRAFLVHSVTPFLWSIAWPVHFYHSYFLSSLWLRTLGFQCLYFLRCCNNWWASCWCESYISQCVYLYVLSQRWFQTRLSAASFEIRISISSSFFSVKCVGWCLLDSVYAI